ncbi:MAG TPA: inositol monophosphatase family protein, partial [Thermoleophilaceae bacterium]|nr:inositol monophosphatase family protein [Thermoleophilaceae bacterium]
MTDLELAQLAVRTAGAVLLEQFGAPAHGVEQKSSATDMVSDADRAAEAAIVELIRRERPDDALLGEEGASAGGSSGRRWVVDPLDGTTNYLYGFPVWAVSVAVEDGLGGLAGAVLDPSRAELFSAARGEGAFVQTAAFEGGPGGGGTDSVNHVDAFRATSPRTPLRVRRGAELSAALVATGFGYEAERRAQQAAALGAVLPAVRDIRRAGAAAIDLAWV